MSDNKELIAQLKRRAEAAEGALKQLREENEELTKQLKQRDEEAHHNNMSNEDSSYESERLRPWEDSKAYKREPLPYHFSELLATTLRLYHLTEDNTPDRFGLNPIETDYGLLNMIIGMYDMSAGFLLDIMRLCVIRKYEYLEVEGYNDAEREFDLKEVEEIYKRLEDNLPELRKETRKRLYKCWETRPVAGLEEEEEESEEEESEEEESEEEESD